MMMKQTTRNHSWHRWVAVMVMLVAWMMPAKAQDDYSGVYFIANKIWNGDHNDPNEPGYEDYFYDVNKPDKNWYLVPAKNPEQPLAVDAYYSSNYGNTAGDPAKPFLTTYRTNRDNNSVWVVKKTGNKYYLIHALTGKYVKFEPPVSSAESRMSVHLEAVGNDSPGNEFQFTISTKTEDGISGYNIKPTKADGTVVNQYLNPAGDNWEYYNGHIKHKSGYWCTGIVGYYNQAGGGSLWPWEPTHLAAPIISDVNVSNNTVTIADANELPSGYEIRYTTDGSTTPTASIGTVYSGAIPITSSVTIKAVVVRYGMVLTEVASETREPVACATPVINFDYTTSEVTITCATENSTIYYTTNGDTPTAGDSEYNTPFSVTSPTTVKAIAMRTGWTNSEVGTLVISQVATPTIQSDGNNAISIITTTPGATIYYTIDGSDPTTSSDEYIAPLQDNVSNILIKAIAVKENMITSAVGSGSVMLQCATPVITREGLSFTLSCVMPSDASLYYTLGGGSETLYEGAVPFTPDQLPMTVTAVARHSNYTQSETASMELKNGSGTPSDPYLIYSANDYNNFVTNVNNGSTANSCYKLGNNITVTNSTEIATLFTGVFDGNSYSITGLTHPLFNTVDGGVVKNVTLKEVAISSNLDTVGAITCIAKGYSRIYNCGILPNTADFPEGTHPTVTTTSNCAGGLVGSLRDDSRVINCYSYADVKASNTASGIVGYNKFASTAAVTNDKYANLRTAIVNCMFYGDITGGTNQYGVYGGQVITNAAATGISSYNYFRNGSKFTAANGHPNKAGGDPVVGNPTAYNCSFPAEERYLTQVEFHRSLLNSNRELCGWWVKSDLAPSTMSTTDVQDIAKDASIIYKWVVDPNLAPYPILKPFGKYPSIVNGNTGTPWFDRTTAEPYQGKQLGTLSVTVQSGTHSSAADQILNIPITDMDTLHYDFGYRKVQLPYYNTVFGNPESSDWDVKYAGNYTDSVVTGWKVKAVDNTGSHPFLADWQDGYNFADRQCTGKDIYDTTYRVFAQGGNYYVPDGVSAITIEAYWGKAIYVRNASASYDRVNITKKSTGSHFAPAGTRGNNVNGHAIQTTTIAGSLTAANIDEKKTVYDYALVLVGNVQESVGLADVVHKTEATRGFTIMSVDLDFDEEPDYCLEWQLGSDMKRQVISPVRFDFLPVVELGIAGKLDGSTNFFSLGCYRSKGHFEVTETAFIRFGQFEFELGERDEGPIILNGGIYDQYCRGRNGEETQNINYVILGGHVVMPSFTPGAHVNSAAKYQTRHCAVNALGGDFASFYLTGGYNEGIEPYEDNPHCYIDGGRFGTIAAAYKEGIWGNVTWRINHALIGEFYGGGVMSQATGTTYKIVKGNIDVVIDNSIVRKYCGGPKFGDMVSDKTVTTSATGTTFGHYYGAGNGGTNYVQYASTDNTGEPISDWSATINKNYKPKKYINKAQGYHADYDIEEINWSTGDGAGSVVNRSYYYSAQFATTNTGDVTSTLTNCTVKNNFYGAGFLGGVTGNVTSTLTDTHVMGSVYGAGYSASSGTVTIHNIDKQSPVVNTYTGMITYNPGGTSNSYTWTDSTTIHIGGVAYTLSTGTPTVTGSNLFYTEISLGNLGAVSNNVTLTLKGGTTVGTDVGGGVPKDKTGDVFGGGEQSAVTGNTTVIIQDDSHILGNVYGGGNEGEVGGNSEVRIKDNDP